MKILHIKLAGLCMLASLAEANAMKYKFKLKQSQKKTSLPAVNSMSVPFAHLNDLKAPISAPAGAKHKSPHQKFNLKLKGHSTKKQTKKFQRISNTDQALNYMRWKNLARPSSRIPKIHTDRHNYQMANASWTKSVEEKLHQEQSMVRKCLKHLHSFQPRFNSIEKLRQASDSLRTLKKSRNLVRFKYSLKNKKN